MNSFPEQLEGDLTSNMAMLSHCSSANTSLLHMQPPRKAAFTAFTLVEFCAIRKLLAAVPALSALHSLTAEALLPNALTAAVV